jgi:hypothetical protein
VVGDANFLTGSQGLVAVDKPGNQVLFFNPDTPQTELTLFGFAPRVHEVPFDRAPARGFSTSACLRL